jgi:hypothetical protein
VTTVTGWWFSLARFVWGLLGDARVDRHTGHVLGAQLVGQPCGEHRQDHLWHRARRDVQASPLARAVINLDDDDGIPVDSIDPGLSPRSRAALGVDRSPAHQAVLLGVTFGRPVRQFILIKLETNSRGFSKWSITIIPMRPAGDSER